MSRLHPFAAAHDRFARAVLQHAGHVELARSDHEIDVRRAAVSAREFERLVAHRLAAAQREFVGRAERDMARRRVLVEERVVEEQAGLRDWRTVRHERDLTEPGGARIRVDQTPQDAGARSRR